MVDLRDRNPDAVARGHSADDERRSRAAASSRPAAGGLPVLLWVLAAAGMLWADVTWSERLTGLGRFHRLLIIPLLLAQFRG
jgi:hypothetical protein